MRDFEDEDDVDAPVKAGRPKRTTSPRRPVKRYTMMMPEDLIERIKEIASMEGRKINAVAIRCLDKHLVGGTSWEGNDGP